MNAPREYLADPYAMTDELLQALLSLAITFHHAQRDYTKRAEKEEQE